MLTIFTIPKPFKGHIDIIQRNAIQSWLKLSPKCEIILFGDEEGVAEAAKEFGILYIPNIEKTEFGTPLLSSAINLAQKSAKNEILLYLNADIILTSDLIPAIQKVKNQNFLISGQRWDIDINQEIGFDDLDWENKLKEKIRETRKLHGPTGMDYFVFPKNLPCDLPDFAVGRPGWDNWLIYHIKSLKIPVIDATEAITAVHQNHESIYKNKIKENRKNLDLAGGFSNLCTIREADFILTKNGLEKPRFPRIIFSKLALFYFWRLILAFKRRLFS